MFQFGLRFFLRHPNLANDPVHKNLKRYRISFFHYTRKNGGNHPLQNCGVRILDELDNFIGLALDHPTCNDRHLFAGQALHPEEFRQYDRKTVWIPRLTGLPRPQVLNRGVLRHFLCLHCYPLLTMYRKTLKKTLH